MTMAGYLPERIAAMNLNKSVPNIATIVRRPGANVFGGRRLFRSSADSGLWGLGLPTFAAVVQVTDAVAVEDALAFPF